MLVLHLDGANFHFENMARFKGVKFIRETHSWNNKKAFRNPFNTLVFSNAFIYNFAKGKTEGFSLGYFSIFFAGDVDYFYNLSF